MRIDEREQQRVDERLPEYSGAMYPTDCTCAERRPGRAVYKGEPKLICTGCGSLRVGTGT